MIFDRGALGPVQVAWASAESAMSDLDAAMSLVGESALLRYRRLGAAEARRFAVGRLLLAELVPAVGTDAATIVSRCAHCGGDHGSPRVVGAPFAVSVSYAGDLVVAAVAPRESTSALGVDIEPRSDDVDAPLTELAGLFDPRTPPGLRTWTEIEAVVKADGRGMRIPPVDVTFGGPSATVLPGGRTAGVPGNPAGFEVASAPGPENYIVSAAVAPASAAR